MDFFFFDNFLKAKIKKRQQAYSFTRQQWKYTKIYKKSFVIYLPKKKP